VLVATELHDKIGKKVLYTPVFRVIESEAAKLAWPHVQNFEAMIEGARTGKFVPVVEREAPGPLLPLVPTFKPRGIRNDASETTFPKLIEEWARKKRIDNPQTRAQRETHFQALAEFLGHNNGAEVTSRDIVRFEEHLEATPDRAPASGVPPIRSYLTCRASRGYSPSRCSRSCSMRARWIRSRSAARSTASDNPIRSNT
jgi:hypothetical protein